MWTWTLVIICRLMKRSLSLYPSVYSMHVSVHKSMNLGLVDVLPQSVTFRQTAYEYNVLLHHWFWGNRIIMVEMFDISGKYSVVENMISNYNLISVRFYPWIPYEIPQLPRNVGLVHAAALWADSLTLVSSQLKYVEIFTCRLLFHDFEMRLGCSSELIREVLKSWKTEKFPLV